MMPVLLLGWRRGRHFQLKRIQTNQQPQNNLEVKATYEKTDL